MIRFGTLELAWNDPAVLIAAAVLGAFFLLLLMILRASSRAVDPLVAQMGWLGNRVQSLADGQERLAGGLHHVSEAQAIARPPCCK